jgi:hypothetical protein
MSIDAEKMMLRGAHRDDSHGLAGQRFDGQMIEQILQRAGERSAIDRARDDDTVGGAHARDDRCGIIAGLMLVLTANSQIVSS